MVRIISVEWRQKMMAIKDDWEYHNLIAITDTAIYQDTP